MWAEPGPGGGHEGSSSRASALKTSTGTGMGPSAAPSLHRMAARRQLDLPSESAEMARRGEPPTQTEHPIYHVGIARVKP